MARSIAPSIAPLIEALELDAPTVVTTIELSRMVGELGLTTPPRVAIQRLAAQGWLLPSGVQGAWEWAPGAHAGPYGHGDPFITLRAQLAVRPDLQAAVGLESAAWLHGAADRAPEQHRVVVRPGERTPAALRRTYDTAVHEWRQPTVTIGGVPVIPPAGVLVHFADAPAAVRNWGLGLEAVPALLDRCGHDDLAVELRGRPHATLVRFAYLVEPFDPGLIAGLGIEAGGTVWFGPRRAARRWDRRWNVADTVLPFTPSGIEDRCPSSIG